MSERYDAIVLGSSAEGLIAAAALARGGLRTLVLDESSPPLMPLLALDPRVVKELGLARHGLQYAVRDMPSVALRADGLHFPLSRDLHAANRELARHARTDKTAWPQFRRRLFRLARQFRKLWWDEAPVPELAAHIEKLSALSAVAWLNAELDTDALKALTAFDIASSGMSPHAPGSALALVWRAAQEVAGLQGAKAMPIGGMSRLMAVLEKAAKHVGVVLDRQSKISSIRATSAGVEGIELAGGEFLGAALILSAFSRHHTLTRLLPRGLAGLETLAQSTTDGLGALRLGVTLSQPAILQGDQHPLSAHFILAERLEQYAMAEAQVRARQVPQEPVIGFTVEGSRLNILAWPAEEGIDITASVLAQLDRIISGAKNATIDYAFIPDSDPVTPRRLLAPLRERVVTSVPGLYLCAAEPMEAVSGRAALGTAWIAASYLRERSKP